MGRALLLWWLSVGGVWRRFRADLASQVTVLVAAGVLLATFFYMFNDFLNTEVKSLSQAMRDSFASWLAPVTLLGAWGIGINYGRKLLYGPGNMLTFTATIAEDPKVPKLYAVWSLVVGWMVIHGTAWAIVFYLLVPYSLQAVAVWQTAMVVSSLFLQFWPKPKSDAHTKPPLVAAVLLGRTKLQTMRRGRFVQIVSRNRVAQLCLLCCLLFLGFVILGLSPTVPAFVPAAANMACGLFLAAALAVQMGADMEHIWSERILGISHLDYQQAYNGLGLMFGVGLSALVLLLAILLRGVPQSLGEIQAVASIALAGGIYPIMLPWIAMQIDPRKVAIPIITIFILGLFVGTAILVNALLVLLVPFLKYYAEKSQDGRFYRA